MVALAVLTSPSPTPDSSLATTVFVVVGFVAGVVYLGEFTAVRVYGPLRIRWRNRKRRDHPRRRFWAALGAAIVSLVATIGTLFIPALNVRIALAAILVAAFVAGNYADYRDGRGRSKAAGLSILRATYGAGEKWADVKGVVVQEIKGGRIVVDVTNDTMGGDPIYGLVKTLKITYTVGTALPQTVEVSEGGQLSLP